MWQTILQKIQLHQVKYCMSEVSLRVRHTMSRQPHGRKIPCVQLVIQYGGILSHRQVKIEYSNILTMTWRHYLRWRNLEDVLLTADDKLNTNRGVTALWDKQLSCLLSKFLQSLCVCLCGLIFRICSYHHTMARKVLRGPHTINHVAQNCFAQHKFAHSRSSQSAPYTINQLHNTQCCATWLIVYGPL
jgi:hypothetical protein